MSIFRKLTPENISVDQRAIVAALLMGGAASAADNSMLGDLPGGDDYSLGLGISADGSAVAGASKSFNSGADAAENTEAFIWSPTQGMFGLGDLAGGEFDSWAYDISGDGKVVTGYGRLGATSNDIQAIRWTAADGMVGLGGLNATGVSLATAISTDGTAIVGGAIADAGTEAFRWTSATGMVGLGDVPGGYFSSYARGVNRDGSIVVGNGRNSLGTIAFKWTAESGFTTLGELPGGAYFSAAYGVSDDGSVVVGGSTSAASDPYREAFRWTPESGMVALGYLAGGTAVESYGLAVSADGNVVVGFSRSSRGKEGVVWTAETGMVSLTDYLTDLGVQLNGLFIGPAYDVSPDGRYVSGSMRNSNGQTEAYIVDLLPLMVSIDFDPWSSTNEFRPNDNYLVAVGIHSTSKASGDAADFDALQVDPASLKFGPAEAANVVSPLTFDIDADGDIDIVFGFRSEEAGLACGDTRATLQGAIYAGEGFISSDEITTTGCETSGCHP